MDKTAKKCIPPESGIENNKVVYRPHVLSIWFDPNRHDINCDRTIHDCEDLKKGSGPWNNYSGPSGFLDSNKKLLHDYTLHNLNNLPGFKCQLDATDRSTFGSARCYRSDYPTDDDSIIKCCMNTDPDTFGPIQCDPKYCSDADSISPGCAAYFTEKIQSDPKFAESYYEKMKEYMGNDAVKSSFITMCSKGKNLSTPACVNFCNDPVFNTGETSICTDIVKKYCSTKKFDDVESQKICGCFYDDNLYSNFYKDLSKKIKMPPGVLLNDKQCFFPACSNADYKLNVAASKCQDLNVVNCIRNVKITNEGTIMGDVTIDSAATCSIIKPEESPSGDYIWSDCSVSCGDGIQTGTCPADKTCSGGPTITKPCKIKDCPPNTIPGEYIWSSCSKMCGGGIKTGICPTGKICTGPATIPCNIQECSLPSGEYGPWSSCSVKCGGGMQTRTCPTGKKCTGKASRECNTQECPPEENPEEKPSFWKTTPGYITIGAIMLFGFLFIIMIISLMFRRRR